MPAAAGWLFEIILRYLRNSSFATQPNNRTTEKPISIPMATGINKVILMGNLGRDPDIKVLEGGAKLASFPMATTEYYRTKDDQRKEQTEWHNVVMWRGLADYAEKYLKKGCTVFVEGKLRTRSWEDANQHKNFRTEVVAESITLVTNRREEGSGNAGHAPEGHAPASEGSGDLPF